MFKWIKKYLQKSVDSVLVLDPAWEVKPKKKKKAKKKKKKKKKSPYDEPVSYTHLTLPTTTPV